MVQDLPYLRETASQTAGPYVHIGLAPGAAGFHTFETELGQALAPAGVAGPRVTIEGCVYDGLGAPVKDILIEVWQADPQGIYPHPEDPRFAQCTAGFRGWGRVISDFDSGQFCFETLRPGAVAGRAGRMQAPVAGLTRDQHRAEHADVFPRRSRRPCHRSGLGQHRTARARCHTDCCGHRTRQLPL